MASQKPVDIITSIKVLLDAQTKTLTDANTVSSEEIKIELAKLFERMTILEQLVSVPKTGAHKAPNKEKTANAMEPAAKLQKFPSNKANWFKANYKSSQDFVNKYAKLVKDNGGGDLLAIVGTDKIVQSKTKPDQILSAKANAAWNHIKSACKLTVLPTIEAEYTQAKNNLSEVNESKEEQVEANSD